MDRMLMNNLLSNKIVFFFNTVSVTGSEKNEVQHTCVTTISPTRIILSTYKRGTTCNNPFKPVKLKEVSPVLIER